MRPVTTHRDFQLPAIYLSLYYYVPFSLPSFFVHDASPVHIYNSFPNYPNIFVSVHAYSHASCTFPTALTSTPPFPLPKARGPSTLSYYYASPGHPPPVLLPITPLANHSSNPLFHERSGKLLSYNSIARRLSKLAGKSASTAFRVDPCFEYQKEEVLAKIGR